MKKILATVLALTMIVGMSITAFAAEVTEEGAVNINDTVKISVEATFNDRGSDVYNTVYSINVEWDDMVFEYSSSKTVYNWNPSTLDYDVESSAAAGWDKASANIVITNRSNAVINVAAEATEGFTVTNAGEVASADVDDGENAPQTRTLVVTPPASIADDVEATVTLTITAA